jgi:drug/metabolite transporter (DMT)-like permease
MTATSNRFGAAALAILGYAVLIGFTDNFVRVIARDAGLWQFHATRTAIVAVMFLLAAPVLGLVLRPRNWRAVVARSAVLAGAMLIYFGCLAFLTVAQVAAGLFTAPIFVLILGRVLYGHAIGPLRILAALVGFMGVVLVLGPTATEGVSWASVLPVAAGALYAMSALATREWCAGESAAVLTLGFFLAIGVAGLVGMGVLALVPLPVAEGADGFITRGPVWPGTSFLWWTFVQALGSAVGVGLAVRAYQLAEANRVSVLEYAILPVSAGWGWLLWAETLTWGAVLGMALIALAGVLIAARAR